MLERFDLYDITTSLLHGVLLLAALIFLFPQLNETVNLSQLSESFSVIIFISIAYVTGQIITTVSSLFQFLLFWTFGGKPSDKVFSGKFPVEYLPRDIVSSAKEKLQKSLGVTASDSALFLKAASIAKKAEGSLSELHNRMYAFNRSAVMTDLAILCLFIISWFYGRFVPYSCCQKFWIVIGFIIVIFLHWNRARQRALYYVREVIIVSERELSKED